MAEEQVSLVTSTTKYSAAATKSTSPAAISKCDVSAASTSLSLFRTCERPPNKERMSSSQRYSKKDKAIVKVEPL